MAWPEGVSAEEADGQHLVLPSEAEFSVFKLCLSSVLPYFQQVASPLNRTGPLIPHGNAKHPRVMEACVGLSLKARVTILIMGTNMR